MSTEACRDHWYGPSLRRPGLNPGYRGNPQLRRPEMQKQIIITFDDEDTGLDEDGPGAMLSYIENEFNARHIKARLVERSEPVPGPYVVVPPDDPENFSAMHPVSGRHHHNIEIHDGFGRTATVYGEPSDPEHQATARLLAAAPRMRELLQGAYDDPDSGILGDEWNDRVRDLLQGLGS